MNEEVDANELVETIAEFTEIIWNITGENLTDILVDYTNNLLSVLGSPIKVRIQDSPMEMEEDTLEGSPIINLRDENDTGYAYTSKKGYQGESSKEPVPELDKYTNKDIKEDIEQAMTFMQNIMDAILDDKARVEMENEVIKAKHNNLLNYLKGEK